MGATRPDIAALLPTSRLYRHDGAIGALYEGARKVWEPESTAPPPFQPTDVAGLAIWLDASTLPVGVPISTWPNGGSGAAATIAGSPGPTPTVALNGLAALHIKAGEGMVRMTGTGVDHDFTLVFLARQASYAQARLVGAIYPSGGNFVVGWHQGSMDMLYDGSFGSPPVSKPNDGSWRLYSADMATGAAGTRLFIDGTAVVQGNGAQAWGGTLAINGYDAALPPETGDGDVAEVLIYNRKLSDAERQQVESYLRAKWLPALDPATTAYLAASGLPASYAPALDGLVVGLKTKGLWAKMRAVYPFIGGTAALHRWNLLDPRDLDAAYRLTFNPGTGTHSDALGYLPNPAPDSTAGWADTHLVPAGLLPLESSHLALYSLAARANAARCDMGSYNWDGTQQRFHLICHYTTGEFYYSLATGDVPNVVLPASTGLFVSSRTSTTDLAAYRNGAAVARTTSTASRLPDISARIGGLSGYEREYSDLPFGFASIGAGLSDQDVADLYTVVQAYQAALGRAVAPSAELLPTEQRR